MLASWFADVWGGGWNMEFGLMGEVLVAVFV